MLHASYVNDIGHIYDNTTRGRKEHEKDYLRLLSEQWFTLFDRMAEIQFVGGPWMLDKNNKPNVAYASTLEILAWPCGKKQIVLQETREKAALVLQRAKQGAPTMQPFVHVASIVDLTTPTKVMHRHGDMMDLTAPSFVLQAEKTNDKSDFLLQDTDEEHEVGGIMVSTLDSGSKDLAFHLQREFKEEELEVSHDANMQAAESVVTQSQVANELDDDPLAQNTDACAADGTSMEQSQVANCVNKDVRSQLNSHEEIPREFLEEPTSTIRMGVSAGAFDKSLAVSQPVHESAVDDPNKVTIKHLDSFDAKRLQIPKRPQMGNDNMFKRLRLETDYDDVSKLSTEKQKTRARDVLQRQMEEDQKVKALEAEYEASSRKKICNQSLKTINKFHETYTTIPHEEEPLLKRNSDYEIEL